MKNDTGKMNMPPLLIRSAVVTGPTGAIGTALCRRLLARGAEVYAVCRPGSGRVAHLPVSARLHVMPCDLGGLSELSSLIPGGADAFFHLAWAKTTGQGRNDMTAQTENIRCAIEAVHAAAALGCKVFVGAGSQAECGRVDGLIRSDTPCFPENGYGMAKLCAGEMSRVECARLGVRHIWMRVLSVYGPGDGAQSMISTVTRLLLAGKRPALTAGEQLWDYIYSDDAAEAFCLAAERGRDGALYPLGSGQARPLREYIDALRDAIDPALPLGYGDIPYGPQQVMHLQADIGALRRDTGFSPGTDFAAGIRKTIDWIKEQENGR